MRRLSAPGLTGLVLALFAAGCAGTSSPGSPTASSPTGSVTSSSVEGGLLVAQGKGGNGNGKGNGNGRGHDPGGSGRGNGRGNGPNPPGESNPNPPSAPPANPVTGKAEIEGLIAGIAGLSLTVNGQTVLVPDTAVIRHGSRAILFAELQVGDRVHVKASRLEDGTLEATEVKVQNPIGNPNDDVNDDGSAIVRVAVLDGAASETGPDTGAFRLTRVTTASLPLTSPLTVSFTLTGTATNGTDYQNVPLTAAFLAGQDTVDVVVTPIVDNLTEEPETVVLTLTNAAPYVLGMPTTATVTIADLPLATP